jgi:hypothetical protein
MITQRLKVDGRDIVKEDGSLFTAWGHNGIDSDHLNETEFPLSAGGKCFSVNNVSWTKYYQNVYTITLTVNESLSNLSFSVGSELISISNIDFTAINKAGGTEKLATFKGAGLQIIRSVNVGLKQITVRYNIGSDVHDGSQVVNGVAGKLSTEYMLAVLKANNSKIIRFNILMWDFLYDKDTIFTASTNTIAPGKDPLEQLAVLLNLAAKYDVYVIICGSNTFTEPGQPDWLAWTTEDERITAQKTIFRGIAKRFNSHPAIAWYSLINEPWDNDKLQNVTVLLNHSNPNNISISIANANALTIQRLEITRYAALVTFQDDIWKHEFITYTSTYLDPEDGTFYLNGVTRQFNGYGDFIDDNFLGNKVLADIVELSSNPEVKPIWQGATIYNPYLALIRRGRTNTQIAREWITTMKNEILYYDPNALITQSTIYIDAPDKGTSYANIGDLLDILSPHQYVGLPNPTYVVDRLIGYLSEYYNNTELYGNKPIFLEEGAFPAASSYRSTINYLLKSKKYLAGGLSNLKTLNATFEVADWPISVNANGVNWHDSLDSVLFDIVKQFLNDSPNDDPEQDLVDYNPTNIAKFLANGDNKPRLEGKRYLSPTADKQVNVTQYSTVSGAIPAGTYKYVATGFMDDGTEAYPSYPKSITITGNKEITLDFSLGEDLDYNSNLALNFLKIYRYGTLTSSGQSYSNYWFIGDSVATEYNTLQYVDNGSPNNSATIKFAYLYNSITSSSTSIRVTTSNGTTLDTGSLPSSGLILVGNEYIKYGAISGNYLINLTRGMLGTSAGSATAGSKIYPTPSNMAPDYFTFVRDESTTGIVASEPPYGVPVDGAYIAQMGLTKADQDIPGTSYMYLSGTPTSSSPNTIFNLNSFSKRSNQVINYAKASANYTYFNKIQTTKKPISYSTNYYSYAPSLGSVWYNSNNHVAISSLTESTNLANQFGSAEPTTTVTLGNGPAITSSQTLISLASVSSLPNSGIVLIDSEFIRYSSKTSSLTGTASYSQGQGTGFNYISVTVPSGSTIAVGQYVSGPGITTTVATATLISSTTWRITLNNAVTGTSGQFYFSQTLTFGSYVTSSIRGMLNNPAASHDNGASVQVIYAGYTQATIDSVQNPSLTVGLDWKIDPTTIPSGRDLVKIDVYTRVRVGPSHRVQIDVRDLAGSITYTKYSTGDYLGVWSASRAYVTGDLVYSSAKIYKSLNSNTNKIPSSNPSNWSVYQNSASSVDGFVQLKIPMLVDNNTWINENTGSALAYEGNALLAFDPKNFKVRVFHSTGSGTGSYLAIHDLYAETFIGGNADSAGTEMMQIQLYKASTNQHLSGADITLKNNATAGWATSNLNGAPYYVAFNTSGIENNLDSFELRLVPNANATYTVSNDIQNLNLRTAYVAINMTETLATKGTPIVSIG